jgi:hypothetical protein
MLIEQAGSTIVIGPSDSLEIDAHANVRVSVGAGGQVHGSR